MTNNRTGKADMPILSVTSLALDGESKRMLLDDRILSYTCLALRMVDFLH